MTDRDVKAVVRARDGYRCRDCGMTNDEHVAKYEHTLDVHRLLPGTGYQVAGCVTLCRACHGKKPKSVLDALYCDPRQSGAAIPMYFNLYTPGDRSLWDALEEEAKADGIGISAVVERILLAHFNRAPLDYCI